MRWELIKLDLHKVAWGYAIIVCGLIAYVLGRPTPFSSGDSIATGLGLLQGWFVAWRIFGDRDSTRAFVFSRSFGRKRLFWHRWALGMALQGLTLLLVCCTIAIGARSYLHHRNSPWYPMVKWYDLNVLWPIAVFGLIAFNIQMFMMLRGFILAGSHRSRRRVIAGRVAAVIAAVLFVLGVLYGTRVSAPDASGIATIRYYLLGYAALVSLFAAIAARHCIIYMEIES